VSERNGKKRAIESIRALLIEPLQWLKRFMGYGKWAKLFVLLALGCILISLAVAQTTVRQNVSSYGTISVVGVGVYSDAACTTKFTSIAWGTIIPGSSVSKSIYVKNLGSAVGTLSLSYGNCTPSTAATFFSLSWNCTNYALARGAVVGAKLTLAVKSSITGVTDFSFSISIQASG
jgi:hypothetical protein